MKTMENESEPKATSDRPGESEGMSPNQRQLQTGLVNPKGMSPNQRQRRTGLVKSMGIKSEPKATSDRFGEPIGNQVRTRGNFRQAWLNKGESSPNQR